MSDQKIQFNNGAAYERYMGKWSQLAGHAFLDWLAPSAGLRWLDVGCGNGAFTQLIVDRCAPASIVGVDPSAGQLAFARDRFDPAIAQFESGDALALPIEDHAVDIVVMPLVIFFVPDPPKGVAEMVRVARQGGVVAAYAWDMEGGGFPYAALQEEMLGLGHPVPQPPSLQASRLDVLQDLWTQAGLVDVQVTTFTVERTFDSFQDYWEAILGAPSAGPTLKAMSEADLIQLQSRMRARLPAGPGGRITYFARANAAKGTTRVHAD